jgi:hypothetical protein
MTFKHPRYLLLSPTTPPILPSSIRQANRVLKQKRKEREKERRRRRRRRRKK